MDLRGWAQRAIALFGGYRPYVTGLAQRGGCGLIRQAGSESLSPQATEEQGDDAMKGASMTLLAGTAVTNHAAPIGRDRFRLSLICEEEEA